MSDSNYGRNNSICSEISVTYLHATALNYITTYGVTFVNKPMYSVCIVRTRRSSISSNFVFSPIMRDTFVSYISYRIPTITSSSLQEE